MKSDTIIGELNRNKSITFIYYNQKDNEFDATVLLQTEQGIIPYMLKNVAFILNYPNIVKKLMEGNKLYLDSFKGYIGIEQIEGPYGEEQVFASLYECQNPSLQEIIISLDKSIQEGQETPKKLTKIGPSYKEIPSK